MTPFTLFFYTDKYGRSQSNQWILILSVRHGNLEDFWDKVTDESWKMDVDIKVTDETSAKTSVASVPKKNFDVCKIQFV